MLPCLIAIVYIRAGLWNDFERVSRMFGSTAQVGAPPRLGPRVTVAENAASHRPPKKETFKIRCCDEQKLM